MGWQGGSAQLYELAGHGCKVEMAVHLKVGTALSEQPSSVFITILVLVQDFGYS